MAPIKVTGARRRDANSDEGLLPYGPYGSYDPDATTSGLTASTLEDITSTASTYGLNIDVPTVFRRKRFLCYPKVRSAGVEFYDCDFAGGPLNDGTLRSLLTLNAPVGGKTKIVDSRLKPAYPNVNINGITGFRFRAERIDINDTVDGIQISGDDWDLFGVNIHDLIHYDVDPRQTNGSHDDGLQIQGGARGYVLGTHLEGGRNSAVQVTKDLVGQLGAAYDTRDVVFEKTYFALNAGAGTSAARINMADKGRGRFIGFRYRDCIFGRQPASNTVTAYVQQTTSQDADWEWSNMRWSSGEDAPFKSGGAGS